MTKVELPPFVDAQRGRDGVMRYYYFRRNGRRWRLPGAPFSEDFSAEYSRLLADTHPSAPPPDAPGAHKYPAGSMGRLILEYLASAKFGEKKTNHAG